jgi:hypothetical protein
MVERRSTIAAAYTSQEPDSAKPIHPLHDLVGELVSLRRIMPYRANPDAAVSQAARFGLEILTESEAKLHLSQQQSVWAAIALTLLRNGIPAPH